MNQQTNDNTKERQNLLTGFPLKFCRDPHAKVLLHRNVFNRHQRVGAAGFRRCAQHLIPQTAGTSKTFARFRFSSSGGLSFIGAAQDGEVEDYAITITAPGSSRLATGILGRNPVSRLEFILTSL